MNSSTLAFFGVTPGHRRPWEDLIKYVKYALRDTDYNESGKLVLPIAAIVSPGNPTVDVAQVSPPISKKRRDFVMQKIGSPPKPPAEQSQDTNLVFLYGVLSAPTTFLTRENRLCWQIQGSYTYIVLDPSKRLGQSDVVVTNGLYESQAGQQVFPAAAFTPELYDKPIA